MAERGTQRDRVQRLKEKTEEARRRLLISETPELALVRRIVTQLQRVHGPVHEMGHYELARRIERARSALDLELKVLDVDARPRIESPVIEPTGLDFENQQDGQEPDRQSVAP